MTSKIKMFWQISRGCGKAYQLRKVLSINASRLLISDKFFSGTAVLDSKINLKFISGLVIGDKIFGGAMVQVLRLNSNICSFYDCLNSFRLFFLASCCLQWCSDLGLAMINWKKLKKYSNMFVFVIYKQSVDLKER